MHLSTVKAISGLHTLTHTHTSCLYAISMSPLHHTILKRLFSHVFSCLLHPYYTHTHTSPWFFLHHVCPCLFSLQSNYSASEGGNLLSLVAAQLPIRGNGLHLSNELITLNELKTLWRCSRVWKKAAGR